MTHRHLSIPRRAFAAGITAGPLVPILAGHSVGAQEATPSGMTPEETQQVLGNYSAALLQGGDFGQYMAQDVRVQFLDVGEEVSGRDAVVIEIHALHAVQFNALPEVVSMVVGAGIAAAEALFVATHTDEFRGIPMTGMTVRVPYAGFFILNNGLISELRLYGIISGVMEQLSNGIGRGSATSAAADVPYIPQYGDRRTP